MLETISVFRDLKNINAFEAFTQLHRTLYRIGIENIFTYELNKVV